MVDTQRPNTTKILDQLKDFQRDTVEYVFRRMYLDPDCSRRFLIADEVGLGKTLVARGLIAKAIDFLWDRSRRIDIIYVCSNTDIARQNINRLNVTEDDFTLSSRITLLPIKVHEMRQSRLNFISFTPGTTFELQNNPGWSTERELLYWLLKECWSLSLNRATVVLQGNAGIKGFRRRVTRFPERNTVNKDIAGQFAGSLSARKDLRQRFELLCEQMPRAGATVPSELHWQRNQLIGELRKVLAQTCLRWLKPDLIILDEFQRFKHLLQGESDDASEASRLAHQLFNYDESQTDAATAPRVLLLSATPYKMYTLSHETEQDDHYADFRTTLNFLAPNEATQQGLYQELRRYREELFQLADLGTEGLLKAKQSLEHSLGQVMVRTERLALSADRNGMLAEITPERMPFGPSDIEQYLTLQRIARLIDHDDVMDYWKSAPYLLNFMEEYDLKRKVNSAMESSKQDLALVEAIAALGAGLLHRREVERYRQIDPGNPRLGQLHKDIVQRGAWRLLWVPPALAYYQGVGPFSDPQLAKFTKRLVFSCWRVVPKAIAAVLSYEAERCMNQTFRKKARNTPEVRKKRRPLLRFTFRQGKPTGMPVLSLIFPCRTLAQHFDPLQVGHRAGAPGDLLTLEQVVKEIEPEIARMIAPLVQRFGGQLGPADETWYWAAPFLLDRENHHKGVVAWFETANVEQIWGSGTRSDKLSLGLGWKRHVQEARQMVVGQSAPRLGPPPADLSHILALLAIAGPGVVAHRALNRLASAGATQFEYVRRFAAPTAHAFLHLFNLPEVMALLRDREKKIPYWQSVLEYCAAGNLQAVLDEYIHVLVESLGLATKPAGVIAQGVAHEIERCLKLRTSTAQADVLVAGRRRVRLDEPIRFRTRFAMRFGDQDAEDSSEPTRADLVRAAFNSPFWPFVLATTSVGQEGLDFHTYCHAVVHWNLPSNPVDLEQREGRIHRYKGHAVRKNIASEFTTSARNGQYDPWSALFAAARASRPSDENDLFPYWIAPRGDAKIERHILTLPHSREVVHRENLRRALVLYRMVFGQNRQEDILSYLEKLLPPDEAERVMALCRIDLSPPRLGD